MNKRLKTLLLAIVLFGIMSLQAGDSRKNIFIGNGNKLGIIYQGSGASQVKIGNNCIVGDIATEDGFAMCGGDNSVTVSNKSVFGFDDVPTKIVRLKGVQQEMPLESFVESNGLNPFECVITIAKTGHLKKQIMFCDQAVIEAGLHFGVKNGRLVPKLPKDTTIRFEDATKDKPLCIITQMLQNRE